jgi:Holliday junction resolvase
MKTYAKGARAESELIHYLNYKGFAVMRAPSSGGWLYPLDIVAIKKGLILAFEIKHHEKKPKIDKEQLSGLREWCNKAGAIGLIGWRSAGNKWLFLRLEDAEANKYEDENWIGMERMIDLLF